MRVRVNGGWNDFVDGCGDRGGSCSCRVACARLPLFGGRGACRLFGDLGDVNVCVGLRYGGGETASGG